MAMASFPPRSWDPVCWLCPSRASRALLQTSSSAMSRRQMRRLLTAVGRVGRQELPMAMAGTGQRQHTGPAGAGDSVLQTAAEAVPFVST